jgi:chromosome partitioning protein
LTYKLLSVKTDVRIAVYKDEMTKVITLCTSKGGTSKTSIAASLLNYWDKKGLKVAGVDADPNCNLTRWLDKGNLKHIPHVAQTDEGEIINTVEKISSERDLVVVDIAGFGNQSMVYA